MSRHHFRSQPTLQRSGEGASSTIVAVAALAVIAAGLGAWLGERVRAPAPAPAEPYAAPLTDEPAKLAGTPPRPQDQITPTAPQTSVIEGNADGRPSGVLAAKVIRAAPKTAPLLASAAAAKPQDSSEQRRKAYERARAAYDAEWRLPAGGQ